MKITINNEVLEKYKLSKEQFFFMMSIAYKLNEAGLESLLNRKFYISQNYSGGIPQHNFFLSKSGIDMLNKIILESDHLNADQKDRLEYLAKSLQEFFPKGKKSGTANYWKGNLPEIRDRLQQFFKKYGNYTDEQVIQATENYIESYKNNTTLMRVLKYFIFKKTDDGVVSDLMTYIENIDSMESGELNIVRLI